MSERMCPNEDCERFGKATKLMGGCDCGTPLVPFRTADQRIMDAAWEIARPGMKRMVGYALLAEMERRRS